jgi:hypothetical protein
MSVSGISSDVASATTDVTTALKQRRQSMQSLLTAVRSGDLSSAQQALTALQQTGGGRPGGPGDAAKNGFAAIASAVSSGDISGAQSALAAWQSGRGAAPTAGSATSASASRDQFTGDFASILNAVQSGSISAAQDALKALQSDAALYSPASKPAAPAADATSTGAATTKPASPISDDVQSLFAAVQSGDSTAAKAALDKLKADAAAQPHHGHHHGGGAKPAAAAATTTDSSTESSTAAPSGGAAGIADVDGQATNA